METIITIDREPGAPTVGISSTRPAIYITRDAETTDAQLVREYADCLDELAQLDLEERASAR